jgi:myo-inositol-1(or 4)-monophosphatase
MLQTLIEVARRAGCIAQEHAGRLRRDEVFHKGDTDLVTHVDQELEAFIRDALAKAFPGVAFYGEEGSYAALADQERVFIVDPLDGTTSFVHGHPFYSVSLAYREEGLTRLGVVYLPAFAELYWAQLGGGAFHDGQRLQVSETQLLIESLAATGFACVQARLKPDGLPLFNDLIYRIRGIRRCGSAAVDLCYVAEGRYDLFWELNLQPWDTAAGVLMVHEAGGRVSDLGGGPEFEARRHLVASNGRVHNEFLAVAARYPRPQPEARQMA